MIKVALTGGIGSGKSEVEGLLAARGATVVDADALAREVVAPGTPGLAAVLAEFGPTVRAADGSLDRAALAAVVFPDPPRLARLEAILHPLVAARAHEMEEAAELRGDAVLVHSMPLLADREHAAGYDLVVVVDAPDEVRLERLVAQRGLAEQDARARMAAQASREQRLAIADVVVRNDGTLDGLVDQVDRLWSDLTARTTPRMS